MEIWQFKQSKIPIIEIFNSVSGEGVSAGTVMTFVRTAGCNLRCSYCDTDYSYDELDLGNQFLTPDEIIEELKSHSCINVLCTGGEPLEPDKCKRYLPLYIAANGFKVRIETNGSCPIYSKQEIEQYTGETNGLSLNYSLDVKCPDSEMSEHNIYEENFKELTEGDEIKFIVGSNKDIVFALTTIKKYSGIFSSTGVTLNFSPAFGRLHPADIVDMLKENNSYFEGHNLNVRLSLQIHKFIWPPEQRGV